MGWTDHLVSLSQILSFDGGRNCLREVLNNMNDFLTIVNDHA